VSNKKVTALKRKKIKENQTGELLGKEVSGRKNRFVFIINFPAV
jgi:hypothetical protein